MEKASQKVTQFADSAGICLEKTFYQSLKADTNVQFVGETFSDGYLQKLITDYTTRNTELELAISPHTTAPSTSLAPVVV